MSDTFVRPQTTIPTYGRVRRYEGKATSTQIYWQYLRRRGFLRPWKVTIIADDRTGITADEIESVIRHCHFHRILLVELAIDFLPRSGVNVEFVNRHAVFGKSRRDFDHGGPGTLRYGTRKSPKLVRVYFKGETGRLRVELELHSALLRANRVQLIDDLSEVDAVALQRHVKFVRIDVLRLRKYLVTKFGRYGRKVFDQARRQRSIHATARYLRQKGVDNVHRFFKPLKRLNGEIYRAINEWSWAMQGVYSGDERK